MGKTFGLSAVAGALIAWNWMRLEQGPRLSQIVVLGLLAIVPALFRSMPARVAAAVVAFLIAAGSAFRLSASVHYPRRLLARFGNGFLRFSDYKIPVKAAALPNMHGTIVLAALAVTFPASLAIAGRGGRPPGP